MNYKEELLLIHNKLLNFVYLILLISISPILLVFIFNISNIEHEYIFYIHIFYIHIFITILMWVAYLLRNKLPNTYRTHLLTIFILSGLFLVLSKAHTHIYLGVLTILLSITISIFYSNKRTLLVLILVSITSYTILITQIGINNITEISKLSNNILPYTISVIISVIIVFIHRKIRSFTIDIMQKLEQTNEELQQSNEKYKLLSELTFEGIVIHKDGAIIDVNPAIEKITGINRNKLLGKNFIGKNFFEQYVPQKHHEKIEENIRNRITTPYSVELYNKNRELLSIEFESKNITTKNNENIRVTAVRDVTEKNKNSKLINKLITAAKQSPAHIVITDTKGNIEYVNTQFEKVSGYSKTEAIGQNPRVLKSGYHTKEFYQNLWKTISSGKTWHGEFYNITKNGKYYWEEASISPVFDKNRKIVNYIAIKLNITKRKNAEKKIEEINNELKISNNKLKLQNIEIIIQNKMLIDAQDNYESINLELSNVVNKSKAIVIEIDNENNIIRWNNTIVEITGIIANKVIGKNIEDSIIPKSLKTIFKKITKNNSIKNQEITILSINNKLLTILISANKKINNNGDDSGIFIFGQNITELANYRKFLELQVSERTVELKEALDKEKELNILKTKFVSVVSHEFRTPLSAINFYAGFIKNYYERLDKEKIKEKLQNIEIQVNHMTNLLNDVLILGKTQTNNMAFNPQNIKCEKYFRNIIEEVYVSKNKTHTIEYTENIKNAEVFIDEAQGRNIFINLLSNAIKFSPDSNTIELHIVMSATNTKIEITDHGIGIEDSKNIFKMFTRGDNAKHIQGTGLGLSIVKESVKKHKGKIKINSELNKGTTFKITLPAETTNNNNNR